MDKHRKNKACIDVDCFEDVKNIIKNVQNIVKNVQHNIIKYVQLSKIPNKTKAPTCVIKLNRYVSRTVRGHRRQGLRSATVDATRPRTRGGVGTRAGEGQLLPRSR